MDTLNIHDGWDAANVYGEPASSLANAQMEEALDVTESLIQRLATWF